jgi:hypothetical protein
MFNKEKVELSLELFEIVKFNNATVVKGGGDGGTNGTVHGNGGGHHSK